MPRNKPNIELYKNIALKKGGRLITKNVKNTYEKIEWECSKGHRWRALGNNVTRGSWCPFCSRFKKKTIEEMMGIAKSRGGDCLSIDYINNTHKLHWVCSEGHKWQSAPQNIIQGKWCPKCGLKKRGNNTKHSIEMMQEIAKKNGGKCLSKIYKNAHTKLLWECSKGHRWEATPHAVKNSNRWCNKCAGIVRHNLDSLHKIAKERKGECLSTSYKSIHDKYKWKCDKGHIWLATFLNIIHKQSWCPKCSKKRGADKQRGTIEDAINLASERKGKFLSNKYIKASTKYKWMCSVGHIWEASYQKIQFGRWCPECAQGRSEKLVKELFEIIFNKSFKKTRPPWLKVDGELLELDGYNKELKLAFEYQGVQHYKEIDYFTQRMTHARRKELDEYKLKICAKNNVLLLQIPHDVKSKNLQEYITKKAIKFGFSEDKINRDKINIFTLPPYKRADTKFLNNLASKHGGQCLSKYMRGVMYHVEWQCKEGHKWTASPNNVRKGHWCPYCAGNIKKTFKEIQKTAKKLGGKCISTKYVNYKTQLEWQCEEGHVWKTNYNRVEKGIWCPYCRGVRKHPFDIKALAKEKGGKFLSDEYKNPYIKYKWQCKRGHVWSSSYMNIRNGAWCNQCKRIDFGKKQLRILKVHATNKGGKCLSNIYKGAKSKMEWECEKGHRWSADSSHIKRGTWCPTCAGKS